uniref:Uncharacterized protein n=1 Tax=Rhizophora mucronata TaxID=61149 RepID=A0A2P2QEU8_RHIMU
MCAVPLEVDIMCPGQLHNYFHFLCVLFLAFTCILICDTCPLNGRIF